MPYFVPGMSNLRFKPAYNPYTEPSMEIFGYNFIILINNRNMYTINVMLKSDVAVITKA